MTLLSSAHQGWRDPVTHTLRRRCPDPSTGRRKMKTVAAPPQAVDYTKCMGGVDRGDQLRSYHTCARKSQFWWRNILYFLVDVARVNAWLCYKHHHPAGALSDGSDSDNIREEVENKMTHSQFTLAIATSLVDGHARGVTARQSSSAQTVLAHNIRGHFSDKMPGRHARYCKYCRQKNNVTKSGKPKTTRRGCPVCGVNLCPGQCFIKYHHASEDTATTTTTE